MSQKSITSFFKPRPNQTNQTNQRNLSAKRTNESLTSDDKQNKKVKTNGENEEISKTKNIEDIQKKIEIQSQQTPALSSNIGHSWFKALQSEFKKPYFIQLSEFLERERKSKTIYPPKDQIYSWTRMCDINQVKVVIIGQDPYHGPNQAHGLSFSVKRPTRPPPSLLNIYQELESDLKSEFQRPNHGDLSGWARQGVLLLNSCLTVAANNPNSHSNRGWESLTDYVIKWISTNLSQIVFILWGSFAQKKSSLINRNKHLILTAPHPSPFSVHKGFYGCKHFSKSNQYLIKNNKKPIDWNDLP